MNFNQFLYEQTNPRSGLIELARQHPLWPAESDALEDFEAFVRAHVEESPDLMVLELRGLWQDFAQASSLVGGRHHLDLALAAWRDFAAHLRRCSHSPADGCEVAEELLERALEASDFADLDGPPAAC
jgi:hypothetical protein